MVSTERLPDVSAFGEYTYLATEVVFGAVAAALLYRARALRRAAATIAAIYPIAYVWDRYTLEVGVFSIDLRTGREFAGIPVEEHLFAVVVPAFVLGVHETLHAGEDAVTDRVASLPRRLDRTRRRIGTRLGEVLPTPVARRVPLARVPSDEDAPIRGVGVDVRDVR